MKDYERINAGKILKAVYLLVQKYHRQFGLAVACWGKQPGNDYFSFYSLGIQDERGEPMHVGPQASLDHGRGYCLTIYQDHIGIPAWCAGDQLSLANARNKEFRTAEILDWYERNLSLRRLFDDHKQHIQFWRQSYPVGKSEPFLLTWNVMGLFSVASGKPIFSYEGLEPPWDFNPHFPQIALEIFYRKQGFCLHFCGNIAFSTYGHVFFPSKKVLNCWEMHMKGAEPAAIVSDLLALAQDEKEIG